jgi:hypothetical protein
MERMHRLKKIAGENNIALAYLFGSQVQTGLALLKGIRREIHDPLTDIDLGLVFKGPLPGPLERADLYSSLYNKLSNLFDPFPLDLVFLQETHSVFQSSAICGHCIYHCNLDLKETYEEEILRRAADFRPFLERYLDEMLEEVL